VPISNTSTAFGGQIKTPQTGPIVIYPRAYAVVKYIYNDGSELTSGMVPSRVKVSRHPHTQCGTCDMEVNASAVPFDLRRLNGIFLSVFMGAVPSMDANVQDEKYLQFVGYVDAERVERSPDGTKVTLQARDMSSLLRDLKPMYPIETPAGVKIDPTPRYSDTILSAINRILQWAGYVEVYDINDESSLGSTRLSGLVSESGIQGNIPIRHRDVSAWEAIEHTGAVANVLIHIELSDIVLRQPRDAFALPEDPATPPSYSFVFGEQRDGYVNAFEVDIQKKFIRNRKGVRLIAYDPDSRRVITADFPDDSKIPPRHAPRIGGTKRAKPRKISLGTGGGVQNGNAIPDRPRDIIAVGGDGVHTKAALEKLAERYYRERSRQELEGSLTTFFWDEKLLGLRNGDRIEVRVKPELEADVNNKPDEASRVDFLKRRLGINDQAAHVMLAQIRAKESTVFYLRSITHEWATTGARTTVDFISIIEV